ncbi:hypothetical protein JCM10135_07360 [Stetteria hydrogenophila]
MNPGAKAEAFSYEVKARMQGSRGSGEAVHRHLLYRDAASRGEGRR